ncbi:MAG: DUF3089 domain-containing protein [Kordiimonadaceae bacterium]|nr:DUF3089 domain-containing protein [Kordiimonadaceae bacterium]
MADGSKPNAMQLWLNAIEPKQDFDEGLVPPEPDYADAANWAARPEAMAAAAFTPKGAIAIDPADAKVDVFYVHPTTYLGTGNWNADISGDPAGTRASEIVDQWMMPEHAGLFNGCCRIYAPRYRQATLAVFYRPGQSARKALDLAYADVARAFAHYIKHDNGGRPFILAGHSQGAAQLMRLLAEGFDPALKSKLVAAYLLGFRVTQEKAESFAHIVAPAEGSADTGVFVAYDAHLEGTDPFTQSDNAEHWLPTGWKPRKGTDVIAINPVNWSRTVASAPEDHLGMAWVALSKPFLHAGLYMPGDDGGVGLKAEALEAPITPGVSVHIDEHGFLKISKPEQAAFNAGIYGGVYHTRDVSLFYMNLRQNAEDRVRAYLEKH